MGDMADRLQKRKRPREENHPTEEEDSSPITCLHALRLRESGKIKKLPNIYRDYQVHTFDSVNMGSISFVVAGVDTILVVHSHSEMVVFRQHGDQISPALCHIHRCPLSYQVRGFIKSVCYNPHDNSFLIVYLLYERDRRGWDTAEIVSLEIPAIQEGRYLESRRVFPGESNILKWGFDIPICRAMIHNFTDHKFKFCELKEYRVLFAIPDLVHTHIGSGGIPIDSYLKCLLSPGNMDMVMHEEISLSERNGRAGIQLKIYSKINGVLQKEMFLPRRSQEIIEFVVLCGKNTLVMQGYQSQIEVGEICSENPASIKIRNTNIRAVYEPYYLHKRSQFICYTDSRTVHVCNLRSEILVTLEDHPLVDRPEFSYASLFGYSYISDSQDILISLCHGFLWLARTGSRWIYSVNVSSIVRGKCLAKISSEDPNCTEIRKAALNDTVCAFGYDERTHQIFTGNKQGICGVWSNMFHTDVSFHLDEQEE